MDDILITKIEKLTDKIYESNLLDNVRDTYIKDETTNKLIKELNRDINKQTNLVKVLILELKNNV